MVTNLDATKYDPTRTDTYGAKTADPTWSYNPSASHTDLCMGYPGGSSPTDATYYNQDKTRGILYNFAAATMNVKSRPFANEAGRPYGTTTLYGQTLTVNKVQGICPNGWHLPSDYEWTELENEIIKNTTQHADVTSNISPDGTTGLLVHDNVTGTMRGTTHGQAMKDPCPALASYYPNGTSLPYADNGFAALLVGRAYTGASDSFGQHTFFWTASTNNSTSTQDTANMRWIAYSASNVQRRHEFSSVLKSIRCKKD